MSIPQIIGGTLKRLALAKIDSKGRISLPREIRDLLGDTVELKPLGKQKILVTRSKRSTTGKKSGKDMFAKLLDSEPRRTGKPENPSPEKMKSIWNELQA